MMVMVKLAVKRDQLNILIEVVASLLAGSEPGIAAGTLPARKLNVLKRTEEALKRALAESKKAGYQKRLVGIHQKSQCCIRRIIPQVGPGHRCAGCGHSVVL